MKDLITRYEINVSLKGRHFFATSERSLQTEIETLRVLAALRERFTEADGFEIRVTGLAEYGTDVTAKLTKICNAHPENVRLS